MYTTEETCTNRNTYLCPYTYMKLDTWIAIEHVSDVPIPACVCDSERQYYPSRLQGLLYNNFWLLGNMERDLRKALGSQYQCYCTLHLRLFASQIPLSEDNGNNETSHYFERHAILLFCDSFSIPKLLYKHNTSSVLLSLVSITLMMMSSNQLLSVESPAPNLLRITKQACLVWIHQFFR